MWLVKDSNGHVRGENKDLIIAMEMAKLVNEFVSITDGTTEIVGRFGVDEVLGEYADYILNFIDQMNKVFQFGDDWGMYD